MDNKRLPVVRVPLVPVAAEGNDGEGPTETPIVDLPPSEKFGFAWPEQHSSPTTAPLPAPLLPANDGESSEVDTSESESLASGSKDSHGRSRDSDQTTPSESPGSSSTPVPSSPPRLNRAFSVPLSSQLGHLNHPHRTPSDYLPQVSPLALSEAVGSANFRELSVELADSVQSIIQTLIHVLPPHLLDPAKEQFAGCSLSVPSPSIAAMLTSMKNLNYMSANISTFTSDPVPPDDFQPSPPIKNDFDIGEMLQSVGDALSGLASQAGVELVLYHSDVGMKHVSVKGDECGISYALSHVIRQVIDTAEQGDTIEIGLLIHAESSTSYSAQSDSGGSRSPSRASSSSSSVVPDFEGTLRVTFEVAHKYGSLEDQTTAASAVPTISVTRPQPRFDTLFFRRLLRHIGGSVREDLKPRLFLSGRSCELKLTCETGSPDLLAKPLEFSPEEMAMRQPFATQNIQLASEPSLEDLLHFLDALKGKKVALHASAEGSFAHHLSSYLTAWGLDVSHMSLPFSGSDSSLVDSDGTAGPAASPPAITDSPEATPSLEKDLADDSTSNNNPTFILIDDDLATFRRRLIELRAETPFNLTLGQRPKFGALHRPKSSPQVSRTRAARANVTSPKTSALPVLIHFTSLSNFKMVKDLVHSTLKPNNSGVLPEVIVLPKPAGPRRVLTALRTALMKPMVDPFFAPIASSPYSPVGLNINPFSPFYHAPSPPHSSARPAISPRTGSDRSLRSAKDGKEIMEVVQRLPPSPLREADTMEYFTEAAEKLGVQSSGLVIQSPDGNPAGIFFYPRGSSSRSIQRAASSSSARSPVLNPPHMARDTGNLQPVSEQRRVPGVRRKTDGQNFEMITPDKAKTINRPQALMHAASVFASESVLPSPEIQTASTSLHLPGGSIKPRVSISPRRSQPGEAPPTLNDSSTESPSHPSPPGSPARRPAAPTSQSTRRSTRKITGESVPAPSPGGKKKSHGESHIVPPINVLIVEDNPINQTILSTFMKRKRIKYDVAHNGAEAVKKWKTGEFHLILMDIQMPIMSGIDATKEIRRLEHVDHNENFPPSPSSPEGQQTPSDVPSVESRSSSHTPFRSSVIIVALTASSSESDRIAALAAGCNDFLTKPVSLQWLNSKIIEWGSIKALQTWADLRPDMAKSLSAGQLSQARSVAINLHVPERKGTRPRSASNPRPTEADTHSAVVASPTKRIDSSSLTHLPRSTDLPSPTKRSSSLDVAAVLDLAEGGRGRSSLTARENYTNPKSANAGASSNLLSPLEDPRFSSTRQISGEDALVNYAKDFAQAAESVADRVAHHQPVILGERNLSSINPSIGEVMHDSSPQMLPGSFKQQDSSNGDLYTGTQLHTSAKESDSAKTTGENSIDSVSTD